MQNSNECKRNFVAVYDGSSSVEDLRNKFCSTVANDVMLVTALGVVRMWADEGSRKSRFRILFTTFQERKPHTHTFCTYSSPIRPSHVCLLYLLFLFTLNEFYEEIYGSCLTSKWQETIRNDTPVQCLDSVIFNVFESFLCSPKLHYFDQSYIKNIVKYYCKLKG